MKKNDQKKRSMSVVGQKPNAGSQFTSAIPDFSVPVVLQTSLIHKVAINCLIAVVITFSTMSQAVNILSGPTFTPAANAPLAGVLQLTTDMPARVSVLVSDGTDVWEKDFYDFATNNSVPLYRFEPGRTNLIQV